MAQNAMRGVRPRTVVRAGAAIVVIGLLATAISVLATRCSGPAVLKEPDRSATKPVLAGVLPGDSGRLANPIGLAWDGSRLYVCESDAGAVAVFDARGRRRGVIRVPAASGATTAYPVSVCVLEGDELALADTAGSRVVVVSAAGTGDARVKRTIGAPTVSQPTAVAADGRRLFVADAADGTIKVFDGPSQVATLGADLDPPLTFVTGMAVADGALLVADSNAGRVVEMDARTGALVTTLQARFGLPRDVVALGNGRVAVADAFERSIVIFHDGERSGAIDAASVPGATLTSVRGLAWDAKRGRLFASDARTGTVVVCDVPATWGLR
jgi:DNA-binding beta-propeller fold protein YncE